MPNRIFVIHDPSLTVNPPYARELFKEIIQQKIHKGWVANGNSNVLGKIDDEFLDLAYKAGCVEWFVGFESVSQDSLNGIKKTVNKVEDFKKMIKRVHRHGMAIQGGIIFGFDQDTPNIFDATLEKMYEWELDAVEINILPPYPGTPLFDRHLQRALPDYQRFRLAGPVALGIDTSACIRSGFLYGTAGAVERILSEVERETGLRLKIAMTGGHSGRISHCMTRKHRVIPHLTLEGLRIIYTRNTDA